VIRNFEGCTIFGKLKDEDGAEYLYIVVAVTGSVLTHTEMDRIFRSTERRKMIKLHFISVYK